MRNPSMNRVILALFTASGLMLANVFFPAAEVFACVCAPPCGGSCTCFVCCATSGTIKQIPAYLGLNAICTAGLTLNTLGPTYTYNILPFTNTVPYSYQTYSTRIDNDGHICVNEPGQCCHGACDGYGHCPDPLT
jgi:hypothetical protein